MGPVPSEWNFSVSEPGPLRNGAKKPDVAAPGAMTAFALSADSSPARGFLTSAMFGMNAGTSMATPFITGVVALLLQQNPLLAPAGKSRLQSASRIPNQAAGTFDIDRGFGLVNGGLLSPPEHGIRIDGMDPRKLDGVLNTKMTLGPAVTASIPVFIRTEQELSKRGASLLKGFGVNADPGNSVFAADLSNSPGPNCPI